MKRKKRCRIITDLILSFIESMRRNEKDGYFNQKIHDASYISVFYLIISMALPVVDALIEASPGIYNF